MVGVHCAVGGYAHVIEYADSMENKDLSSNINSRD